MSPLYNHIHTLTHKRTPILKHTHEIKYQYRYVSIEKERNKIINNNRYLKKKKQDTLLSMSNLLFNKFM